MTKVIPLSQSAASTLRAAVALKDAAVAAHILKSSPNLLAVDLGDGIDFTLLSARTGFVEGLKLAKELGVDLGAAVPSRFDGLERATLLNHAAITSSLETIQYLVEQGVSTSASGLNGHTPLVTAWERIAFGSGYPKDWFAAQCANFEYLFNAGAPWRSESAAHRYPVATIACAQITDQSRDEWRMQVLNKGLQAGWDMNAQIDPRGELGVFKDMPGPASAIGIGLWLENKRLVLELIRLGADTNNAIGQKSLLDLLAMKNAPFPIWASRNWLPEVTEAIMRRSMTSGAINPAASVRQRSCVI